MKKIEGLRNYLLENYVKEELKKGEWIKYYADN